MPWEKLKRTTSTPAVSMRSSTSGSLEAGPRVATILVLRGMGQIRRERARDEVHFVRRQFDRVAVAVVEVERQRQGVVLQVRQRRATALVEQRQLRGPLVEVDERGSVDAQGDRRRLAARAWRPRTARGGSRHHRRSASAGRRVPAPSFRTGRPCGTRARCRTTSPPRPGRARRRARGRDLRRETVSCSPPEAARLPPRWNSRLGRPGALMWRAAGGSRWPAGPCPRGIRGRRRRRSRCS